MDILGTEVDGLDLGSLAGAAVGKDALDAALPGLLELGELDDLGAGIDDIASTVVPRGSTTTPSATSGSSASSASSTIKLP